MTLKQGFSKRTRRRSATGVVAVAIVAVALGSAPRAGAFIYWATTDFPRAIARANLDGTGMAEDYISVSGQVGSVAVDAHHIYWEEVPDVSSESNGWIGRARLDGTHIQRTLIPVTGGDTPGPIAVDEHHIYWVEGCCHIGFLSASIARADLDGTHVEHGFIPGAQRAILGIAVENDHIYWNEEVGFLPNAGSVIARANLDGTAIDHNFVVLPVDRLGARIEADGAHLYWINAPVPQGSSADTISRANLDGSAVDESFVDGFGYQGLRDLAVDPQHLYWLDNRTIGRADLNGAEVDQSFITLPENAAPNTIAVDALSDTILRGKACAAPRQRQQGSKISVRVKVTARERLTAEASGEIEVNPTYKLRPKTAHLGAGETRTLKLKPKTAAAKKIVAALRRGQKAKANVKATLTDLAGNRETESLRVRLKRSGQGREFRSQATLGRGPGCPALHSRRIPTRM